ncbi:hypothetical protein K2173_001486 [Erythroxylum novogranatense]|uniref:Transmembrane protein n=1 Tax=Erythroxylum novogranatense TaxID=1862640 RepID=A0AAV8T3V3_9ROSI|nr:hypothetical protein K2173_001486 [Erythroxylum novogranatense]
MITLMLCHFDFLFLQSNAIITLFPIPSMSTTSSFFSTQTILIQEELTNTIVLLLPLNLSNHIIIAIKLNLIALLTRPLLNFLSFSILINHLLCMFTLLTTITTILVSSYMRKKRPINVLKVYYSILIKLGKVERRSIFWVLISGLCKVGWVLKGLMARLRDKVCRSSLREAVELDMAL